MKKEYSRKKIVLVSFTLKEFQQLQELLELVGLDKTKLIDDSSQEVLNNFCRTDDMEEFTPDSPKNEAGISYFDDLVFDNDYERMITL
ncbi:MAG: hypothetical protein RI909_2202, partial [Bacteroidota bacterium]